MGLINSIGAYFNKFLGGWTFGTQTDQLTVKNSVELEGTTGTIYEHTFQNKDGVLAHLDDITITLPTDTTGSVLFLNASNEFDSDGTYFNWDKVNKRLNLKGNSDTVGNIFVAENLSNTANLVMSNIGILTHTFTNTDYSAVVTGRAVIFKRGTRELSFGSVATFTTTYNSVSNVSIIQSTDNNIAAPLKINPYGGAVHIGSVNNSVIIGNPTIAADSSQSVIIASGNSNYTIPHLIVASYPNGGGLKFYGYGSDGSYSDSQIVGSSDKILFRNQKIYIGYHNPTAFATSGMTGKFEINVGHRTMVDSAGANQDGAYYQKIGYYKGAGADAFSYMMVGSHVISSMGLQMKVSTDGATYTNGNITLNPYGGNVGVGIATLPTATLHVKGNSDSVGTIFRAENLSNTNFLSLDSNGLLTHNLVRSANQFTSFDFKENSVSILKLYSEYQTGRYGLYFINGASQSIMAEGTSLKITARKSNNAVGTPSAILFQTDVDNFQSTQTYVFGGYYQLTTSNIQNGTWDILGVNELLNINGGNSAGFLNIINNRPTINQTAGTGNIVGYNYNPILTSITGAHYGILVRPDTLNGFGLTTNLPTAVMDLSESTTARASLRIRNGVAPTTPNDGDIWNDGTDLFVRLGGTTYTLVKV
jgi:hypothetical protein